MDLNKEPKAKPEGHSMFSIEVKGVSKKFRIYHDKSVTLKERLLFWNRTKYEEHQVLKGIDFNLEKGKTVGLIGQNGSGKSTLLKLLTQIIYPDKGNIIINGKVSSLLELGAGFHLDFSGRENIYNNASIFGLIREEIDKRYNKIVEFSELEDFIDNPVRTYSSGMYMRLAFAVAINVDADVLLIDEILAVGDTAFQKKCLDKISHLKEEGKTIVIVSHDNTSLKKLCDSVIWLDNGSIREYGEADYVIDRYVQFMYKEKTGLHIRPQVAEEKKEEATIIEEKLEEDQPQKIALPRETPQRWGDKEIEITDVKFLNNDGEETYSFNYGDSLKIIIDYKVNNEVKEPVFGMGIFLPDGTRCYGTNTQIEGIKFETVIPGKQGSVSLYIENLDFVSGTYYFNFAVHATDGYAYDYLNKIYSITIYSNKNDIGIFRPKHEWTKN